MEKILRGHESAEPNQPEQSFSCKSTPVARTRDSIFSTSLRTVSTDNGSASTKSSLTLMFDSDRAISSATENFRENHNIAASEASESNFDFFLDLDDQRESQSESSGAVLNNHGHHPMSLTAHNLPVSSSDRRLRARTLSAGSRKSAVDMDGEENLIFDIEVD